MPANFLALVFARFLRTCANCKYPEEIYLLMSRTHFSHSTLDFQRSILRAAVRTLTMKGTGRGSRATAESPSLQVCLGVSVFRSRNNAESRNCNNVGSHGKPALRTAEASAGVPHFVFRPCRFFSPFLGRLAEHLRGARPRDYRQPFDFSFALNGPRGRNRTSTRLSRDAMRPHINNSLYSFNFSLGFSLALFTNIPLYV